MTPEPAKVHFQAEPVERFDQVVRYMRRHGGQATFIDIHGCYTMSLELFSKANYNRYFRRDRLADFNRARSAGFNQ